MTFGKLVILFPESEQKHFLFYLPNEKKHDYLYLAQSPGYIYLS